MPFLSLKIAGLLFAPIMIIGTAQLRAAPTASADETVLDAGEGWSAYEAAANGLIYLDVRLGAETLRALLDTGAPMNTLSKAYARARNLKLRELGDAASVGGNTYFLQTEADSIRVANVRFAAGPILVSDLSFVADVTGRPIDLIIGAPALKRLALELDADRKRLRFTRSGQAGKVAAKVPLRWEGANRMMIAIEVNDHVVAPIIVDTGSDSGISLGTVAYLNAHLNAPVITDVASAGAGGIAVNQIVGVKEVSIGGQRLGTLDITLRPPDDFVARSGGAGLVGMAVLGRYNLVIDPGAGFLGLTPRRTPFSTEAKRTLGLQFIEQADRLRVVHVMLNSPARLVGMKPGDEVCRINGDPITSGWRKSGTGNWGTAAPGTRFEVGLCDGRHLSIITRQFY